MAIFLQIFSPAAGLRKDAIRILICLGEKMSWKSPKHSSSRSTRYPRTPTAAKLVLLAQPAATYAMLKSDEQNASTQQNQYQNVPPVSLVFTLFEVLQFHPSNYLNNPK